MSVRSVSALLCVTALVFSLCACDTHGNGGSSSTASSRASSLEMVNVADYASKGEIFGCEFALRTKPDDIKAAYHYGETASQEGEPAESADPASYEGELMIYEGEPMRMVTGSAKYYYRSWLADEGIAFIAFFDDSYSYYIGLTSKDDVLRTVDAEPIYNDVAQADNLFFYYGAPENVWQIKYKFGDYVLSFFFEEDCLAVTTIYYAPTWTDYATE